MRSRQGEFALSIADDWHGKGLGSLLVADIECRARSLGARHLVGDVLRSNASMKALARKMGFLLGDVPRDARLVRIVKDLTLSQAARPCETVIVAGQRPTLEVAQSCSSNKPLPGQLLPQRLRLLQVARIKPLRKPPINTHKPEQAVRALAPSFPTRAVPQPIRESGFAALEQNFPAATSARMI